jgi:hypothetical protein
MLHVRLYLLFSLVIASESFPNGRSTSIISHDRRTPPPSPRAQFTWPIKCEHAVTPNAFQDSEKGSHLPTSAAGEAAAAGSGYYSEPAEAVHSNSSKFHLLSLQWTPDDDPMRFSKIVTNLWRWKDAALGDGRDYFVPRPKTLRGLQSYLLTQIDTAQATSTSTTLASSSSFSFHVKDCVIISNCARFEILLELQLSKKDFIGIDNQANDENNMNNALLTEIISSALLCQVESFQKSRFSLLLPVDWPGVIDMKAKNENKNAAAAAEAVKELSQHWTHYTNLESIMQHLSHVAAGLATRPRRPDRAVVFRPFSSRDAHILLQLKRTVDLFGRASSSTKSKDKNLESSSSSYLPTLLRFCLQAGKAARNPTVVPELEEMRVYGTGDDIRYSSEVPLDVQNCVVEVSPCRIILHWK